jgi:hypothetical protein
MSEATIEPKDEFVESVQFVPEDFEAKQDALLPELEPEIRDETLQRELPAEGGKVSDAEKAKEESPKKDEGDESVDEKPAIDFEALKTELDGVKERLTKAEKRAGYWERQARKTSPEQVKQPEPEPLNKPKYEDFTSEADFLEALTDYKVETKLREQDRQKAEAANQSAAEDFKDWQQDLAASGIDLFEDFIEIASDPIVPINPRIIDAVRAKTDDLHAQAEIFYYLGKNIRGTAKIARLHPDVVSREIGAIAEKIAADKTPKPDEKPPEEKKPELKKISTAPPPITPLRSGSAGVSKNPENMSNAEYRAWRRGQR